MSDETITLAESDARWYIRQAGGEAYQAECLRVTAERTNNPHLLPSAEAHETVAARHRRAAVALFSLTRLANPADGSASDGND